MKQVVEEEVSLLMALRKDWTLEDFKEAYGDVWDNIPDTLEQCFEKMEEYISHTYTDDYIKTCIENETNN